MAETAKARPRHRRGNPGKGHVHRPHFRVLYPRRAEERGLRHIPLTRWEAQLVRARRSAHWPVRVWAEVLYDAIAVVLRTPFEARFMEELTWVNAPAGGYDLGSFEGCCLVCGLDADLVRADVCKWARTQSVYATRRRAA